MITIDKTIISDELLEKKFVCDLEKCKGACCVKGEIGGAPLEENELNILDEIYEKVKPYMEQESSVVVEKSGKYLRDEEGDWVTPLVDKNKHCVYVFFEKNIAKCAIEKAYNDGKINFRKPVSCHLFPVRITKYNNYEAVNYSPINECSPACELGKTLGVPVYEFLKDGLIRKYGTDWYEQLEAAKNFKEKQ